MRLSARLPRRKNRHWPGTKSFTQNSWAMRTSLQLPAAFLAPCPRYRVSVPHSPSAGSSDPHTVSLRVLNKPPTAPPCLHVYILGSLTELFIQMTTGFCWAKAPPIYNHCYFSPSVL